MEKIDATIVIIDDDPKVKSEEYALTFELSLEFENVQIFDTPKEGLDYIKDNITNKMVVLLDLAFPQNLPDGHEILKLIRTKSFLIPVIIWSGKDEDKETFSDLINNKAFAFLKKSASSEEIITKLKEAINFLQNDISVALEDWINTHSEDQKDKPYMVSVEGKKLSLNDILKEVRMQSSTGKYLAKQLTKLTIDLLTRNKEKLDD